MHRYSRPGQVIVEIGAADFNGSIRQHANPQAHYVGLDIAAGKGVDLVVASDGTLPLRSNSADLVLASSVFEHDDFFWLTFLELLRIAKESGVVYLNSPSNGEYHRYPNDNWRFYPDAGKTLEKWGRRNGYAVSLVESFIAERKGDQWNDFIAIFQREPTVVPYEFLSETFPSSNVWHLGESEPVQVRKLSQDASLLQRARARIEQLEASRPAPAAKVLAEPGAAAPDASPADAAPAELFESQEIRDQRFYVEWCLQNREPMEVAQAHLEALLQRAQTRQ